MALMLYGGEPVVSPHVLGEPVVSSHVLREAVMF